MEDQASMHRARTIARGPSGSDSMHATSTTPQRAFCADPPQAVGDESREFAPSDLDGEAGPQGQSGVVEWRDPSGVDSSGCLESVNSLGRLKKDPTPWKKVPAPKITNFRRRGMVDLI